MGRFLARRVAIVITLALLAAASFITVGAEPASASPVTGAFFDSEPGDYIGFGQQWSFSTVTVSSPGGQTLYLTVSNPERSMAFLIAPPTGSLLLPGAYENSRRSPDASHAQLDVFGDGRGCNQTFGRFIIDEITRSVTSEVLTISFRFEQHCEATTSPALFGAVSYNAAAPYRRRTVSSNSLNFPDTLVGQHSSSLRVTVANEGPSSLAMGAAGISGGDASSFQIAASSCSGATVASGQSCEWAVDFVPTGTGGLRKATLTFYDDDAPAGGTGRDIALSGLAVGTSGDLLFIDSEPNLAWPTGQSFAVTTEPFASGGPSFVGLSYQDPQHSVTIYLDAPTGSTLSVGTYENTRRYKDATHPGLDIYGAPGGCNQSTGRFIIDEIRLTTDGNLGSVAVRFENHCENGDPAVFGVALFNASNTYRTRTVEPSLLDFGTKATGAVSSAQIVTVENDGPSGLNLGGASITGANSGDFQLVGGTCSGASTLPSGQSCTYLVAFAPLAGGPRSARLRIVDDLAPSGGSGRRVTLSGIGVFRRGSHWPTTGGSHRRSLTASSAEAAVEGASAATEGGQPGLSAAAQQGAPAALPAQAPPATPVVADPRFTG